MRSLKFILIINLFCCLASVPAIAAVPALVPVPQAEFLEQLRNNSDLLNRKEQILQGIDHSLKYLDSAQAERAYGTFSKSGISRSRVERSLNRFRSILLTAESAEELQSIIRREFVLYRSQGFDGQGSVKFTGYFQPVYKASRVKTAEYRYPIYRKPLNFDSWRTPHPGRVALEGYNGEGGALLGLEIAWLKSRFQAYMIHVQGSAILEFPNGRRKAVGFAAATNYNFTGISKSCVTTADYSPQGLERYFEKHPDELNRCLAQNNRFVFFRAQDADAPIGSLGVPVVAGQSIATDKSQLPPGALALISTAIPSKLEDGRVRISKTSRFVLDHDTGSAIRGPGRVDIFMGSGNEAATLANSVYSHGALYYLFLKE